LGKIQQLVDNNSLGEGMDKSIQDRQGAISEMSTEELREVKTGRNRDSHNEFDYEELFKSHGVKRMNIGAPGEVLSSEDSNKDMKSTIKELNVESALGSNSTWALIL